MTKLLNIDIKENNEGKLVITIRNEENGESNQITAFAKDLIKENLVKAITDTIEDTINLTAYRQEPESECYEEESAWFYLD